MTNESKTVPLKFSANVIENSPSENALLESEEFMSQLISQISERADFSKLEEISVDYRIPFKNSLNKYPEQAVAIIVLNQPTWAKIWTGCIDSEADLITCRRSSANKWGADTWAVPMGKLEEDKDLIEETDTLGQVINHAAVRELGEEVIKNTVIPDRNLITSSFIDTQTQTLVHVVIAETMENPVNISSINVELPDTREHQLLGWVRLKDFPKLTPTTNNVKFLLVCAVKFIKDFNKQLSDDAKSRMTL